MSAGRWLVVFACATVAWFLFGSGSGFLWSYLPGSTPDGDGSRASSSAKDRARGA